MPTCPKCGYYFIAQIPQTRGPLWNKPPYPATATPRRGIKACPSCGRAQQPRRESDGGGYYCGRCRLWFK